MSAAPAAAAADAKATATAAAASAAKAPIALVTGTSRGIGLGLVSALLARGYRVIATARKPDESAELKALAKANPERVHLVALDVADAKSVSAAVSHMTGALGVQALDVLVNNAGVGSRLDLAQASAADFVSVYTQNVVGPFQLTQACVELLRAAPHGRVVHVSSDFGSVHITNTSTPFPGSSAAYRCSKAALNQLAAVQSREFNANVPEPTPGSSSSAVAAKAAAPGVGRITVLSVHPGWVRTEMGGAQAPLDVATSAAGMAKLIDDAVPSNHLRHCDWQGNDMPF